MNDSTKLQVFDDTYMDGEADLTASPPNTFFAPKRGFGKVWLARNAIGQWQALKTVYQVKFGTDRGPYDTEFRGIQNYKPISDKHPGLLRVDFVSKQKIEGYFYYVMELGDCITPGWEKDPATYRPRDLASVIEQAGHHRLPVLECIRIVGQLAEALEFLHQQGYTHRDILVSRDASALTGSVSVSPLGLPTAAVLLPSNLRDTTQLSQWTQELRLASNAPGPA